MHTEAAQGNRQITGSEREPLRTSFWKAVKAHLHSASVSDPVPIAASILLSDHCMRNPSVRDMPWDWHCLPVSFPQSWAQAQ